MSIVCFACDLPVIVIHSKVSQLGETCHKINEYQIFEYTTYGFVVNVVVHIFNDNVLA